METILATAFGRKVDVLGGEADDLTKAAQGFFDQAEDGRSASREKIILITSRLSKTLLLDVSIYTYY